MITIAPLLPAWLVALLALALAAGAIAAYRRAPGLLTLRLAAVAALALLLLNPVRIPPPAQRDAPRLVLVADASASMGLADEAGGATRLAAAGAALERVAGAAGSGFLVEWMTLDSALRAGRPQGAGGDTAFDALADLAARPPAAVVLASDGAERGAREPDQALAAAGVPVSCIAVGSEEDAGNIALRLDAPSPTAFPGQELELTAVLTCTRAFNGRQVELTLAEAGGASRTQVITLADGLRLPLAVQAGDGAGERLWTAAVQVLEGEAVPEDNRSQCAVRVVDRRLQVAVAEGRPWWDSGVAVRAWRRDRQLATSAHWRAGGRVLATGGEDGSTPPKADAATLRAADLIVLGLEPERVIDQTAAEAVLAAVDGGAGLILLAPGPRPNAIAALDPVLWSAEPPRETRAAPSSGAPPLLPAELLPALPPVLARGADGLRPGASVLLGAADRPLIAMRRHGAGRVVAVNAEGLWRWSLGREDDAAGRLWRQLARLAVRDPGGLSADRPRYRVGMTARLAAPGLDALSVAAPDAAAMPLALADGAAALPLDRPGTWTVTAGEQRLSLPVEADNRERTDTARRDRRLERLAAATGGAFARPEGAAELGARLARRSELMAEAARPVPLAVAWWWWTLIIAAMLAGEWWLRRSRHGRV